MTRSLFFLLLFLLSPGLCSAGGDLFSAGGRSAGMGDASVTLQDVWSVHNNQSGMAWVKKSTGGIYRENKFLLPELGVSALSLVMPADNAGTFGLSMTRFGYALYNEQRIGLGYAKKFGENFSVGMQLNYWSFHIGEGYGDTRAFIAEVGLQVKLSPKVWIGSHLYNPTRATLSLKPAEHSPAIMKIGLSYTATEKVLLCIESEKDIDHSPTFRAGLEYHIVESLYLRTGISENPVTSSFGFGFVSKNLRIDLAGAMHPALGFSPKASVVYEMK